MRIFLYEFVTGGGLLSDEGWLAAECSDAPVNEHPLRAEGRAMITALVQDFLALWHKEPCQIHVLRATPAEADLFRELQQPVKSAGHMLHVHTVSTAEEEQTAFSRWAGECHWTALIAPETSGHLLRRAEAVLAAGGKLLGPPPAFIAIAADKQKTAEQLAAAGVPVPQGILLQPGDTLPENFKYPAVLKPVDGCGSQGVQLLRGPNDAIRTPAATTQRLEQYCAGEPHSMAALCGPNYTYPLQLFRQTLSADGEFRYLGGEYTFDENKENRGRRLVKAALKALPPALGYIGFDLVLGAADDGRQDYVIEINPRLTTSYIGQRFVYLTNIPHMLLETAQGRWPHGRFSTRAKLAFDTSGNITRL